MKKGTLQLLAIGILMTGLIGCGGVSQNEYDTLKAENEKLKKEIEDLKFEPDKLLNQAKSYLSSKDYIKAKSELQTLLDKHSGSQQAAEAKQLLTVVENGIKEQKLADEKAEVEKEKVEKEQKLEVEKAKAEKEKAEKERLANATKKLRTKYDDVKGITWYYDKSAPQYTNCNSFHIYMGTQKNSTPWLRFRIQYTADDWLFIQSYIIKTDNSSYTISTSYGDVEQDNGSGGIWEWLDVSMDNEKYNIIKDIISSKTVKLRYEGQQYYKDRIITYSEKIGLKNVLDAYEALGGSFDF
jgi:hypothetical protein